ncbi:MAG TPA: 50S ribosomal protein L5 [Patescibacteria group bacterium]|nr:50S ribosomal protein L5 [Patescibacteria group bacterium]
MSENPPVKEVSIPEKEDEEKQVVKEEPEKTEVVPAPETPAPEVEATPEEPASPEVEEEVEAIPEEIDEPEVEKVEPEEEAPVKALRRRIIGPRDMREIKIGKVVVNITMGKSGEPLEKAMTIMESLTDQKPNQRRAKQTIRTWGVRKGEPIACLVTLRGERAETLLRKSFDAVRRRVNIRSFDDHGNFAFGIQEHIDIPGQRYDPNLGIFGMDVMVTVERAGYRVARKRRAKSRVGQSHRVTREESIEFIKQKFGVEVGLPVE